MLEENEFSSDIGLRHLQLDNMASEKGYPVISSSGEKLQSKEFNSDCIRRRES